MTTAEHSTNLLTALRADSANPGEKMFAEGDVAVIMKADGSVKAMSVGTPTLERLSLPADQQTDFERMMVQQGRKLSAIVLALGNPQIMDILYSVMDDPTVVDQNALAQLANPN